MRNYYFIILLLAVVHLSAQEELTETADIYKTRVLESAEVDFLMSYYNQDGDNAAVTGGIGTEKLTDLAPTIVVSIPLNEDDILILDGQISAYTSASSSNVNPFDGNGTPDPFVETSGASASEVWINGTGTYTHNSDDRNKIWSAKLSLSSEYDYLSVGFGGSYNRLFNQKNTEVGLSGNIYLDKWNPIYPYELRPFLSNGNNRSTFNPNYNPDVEAFTKLGRNSYSAGLFLSQILSKKLQGSVSVDYILQKGLLSMPLQRVYFSDTESFMVGNFRLADDIERLPDSRSKIAVGGRLNYYLTQFLTVRSFYRYYTDDWGILSNTASIELPVKIGGSFTVYPSFRYYDQTAADYFAPYAEHVSTDAYYTSDYDLSKFSSTQFGFGLSYTDIFTKAHLGNFGVKSIDLKYHRYERNTAFSANLFSFGVHFVMD